MINFELNLLPLALANSVETSSEGTLVHNVVG